MMIPEDVGEGISSNSKGKGKARAEACGLIEVLAVVVAIDMKCIIEP